MCRLAKGNHCSTTELLPHIFCGHKKSPSGTTSGLIKSGFLKGHPRPFRILKGVVTACSTTDACAAGRRFHAAEQFVWHCQKSHWAFLFRCFQLRPDQPKIQGGRDVNNRHKSCQSKINKILTNGQVSDLALLSRL